MLLQMNGTFTIGNLNSSRLSYNLNHIRTSSSKHGNNKITELRTILQRESQNVKLPNSEQSYKGKVKTHK